MKDVPEPHQHASDDGSRKSRLDQEIDEILRGSDKVRAFPSPRASRSRGARPGTEAGPGIHKYAGKALSTWWRRALDMPLLVALLVAIIAFVIADRSAVIASLLALVSVVFVLLPVIQRYRTPSRSPGTKMWRGRVMATEPSPDSFIEAVRRWWRGRTR